MSVPSTPRATREVRKKKKTVTFHPSTVLCDSDHIALTITRHSYIHDKGYTQYFIKLLCRGVEWTLHKRYRDFYDLHHELIRENQTYNIELPKLPEKRWFERQRWINRADEKYGWIRRIQLQDYLRAIVKIRVLRNESLSFWKFVCMPKRVMLGPPPEEEGLERDHSRSVSSEMSVQARFASPAGVLSTGSLASAASARGGDLLSSSPALAASLESFQGEEAAAQAGRFDADKDLESFNESLQLAAREAHLRELYGSRNSKADIDNISSMVRSRSNSEAQSLDAHASPRGGIKLSKVFDDNGEEITASGTDSNIGRSTTDLGYLASSNARLNTRLTSKEEYGGGAQFSPSGGSGAIRAPPVHLAQVNSAWSNAELTSALDAISKEEFDTEVHFTGPRSSGPPSLPSSPNVSLVSGVDLSRNDLNIMPSSSSGHKAGGIAATSPLPAAASAGAAKAKNELPPPGTKHDAHGVNPPPAPGSAEKRTEKDAKRRGSQTSKSKG